VIYLFSKMKDYYRILDIRKEASQRVIFKAFRKEYLSSSNNLAKAQAVFSAYLILSQNSRKYFEILQKQLSANKRLNPKYLNIIANQNTAAKQIIKDLETSPHQIKIILKKYPLQEIALSLVAVFFGFTKTYISWALIVILILIAHFWLLEENSLTYLSRLGLLLLAFILFQKGVMNSRKEKIDQIIKAHT
jgi:hypothetical protein